MQLLLLLILLFSNDIKASDLFLGTVTVEGEVQTGDTDAGSSFATIIKKDQISASQDLATVIEKETSVQVRQSGGLGSFSSISLRGASSDQVMVLLDGIPLNDSSGIGVDLSSIPYSEIRSVEIYRGNTPSVLGKGGIGGTVNIKTLKASDNLIHTGIMSSYSSFNTFKLAPNISQKIGKFDYLINTEYFSSKNNFTFLNDNGTKFNPNDDRWEQRNNSQFNNVNVLTGFGYDLYKDIRMEFSEQYFDKDQNLPSQNNNPLTNAKLSTKRNIASLKLNYFNSSSRLDYTYKNEYYDDKDGTLSLAKQLNRYITNNYGFNQVLETVQKNNIFDFVFDIHREQYQVRDLLYNKPSPDSARNSFVTSIEDKLMMLNESFMVIPAITLEYYDTNIEAKQNSHNGYFNPKLGVEYKLNNQLLFKSNIAKYIREPSFFELIGNRGYFIGNDTLKAERGLNFDIGSEFKAQGFKLEIAYFRDKIDDVISYVYDSSGVGHAVNISGSTVSGIETTLAVEFLKYFSLNSNYTWQLPINKSQISIYDGNKLPGRFEHSFFTRLQFQYLKIKPYYEFSYQNGVYYDNANLLPAPAKREHNLGLTFFIDNFTITGEIKNIGDDHYEDFNGFPQPGRSYWLTAKFDY